MDWSNFFSMGGYATFVWSSYGIALVLLVINIVLPLRHERALRARLSRRRPGGAE